MTKNEFKEWAKKMNDTCPNHLEFFYNLSDVICYNLHNGKVGVARCHPSDKFNIVIGKAIAIARCRDIEIPFVETEKLVCELKNGDRISMSGVERVFIGRVQFGLYAFSTPNTTKVRTYKFNEYDKVKVLE